MTIPANRNPALRLDGKPQVPTGSHDPRFNYRSGKRECDQGSCQKPSAHGAILGAALAKIADAQAVLHPEMPERCKSCAFRAGTLPNQMAGTLVEAMHCVLGSDPNPFGCHQNLNAEGLPTHYCVGYLLARKASSEELKEALCEVATALGGANPAPDDADARGGA